MVCFVQRVLRKQWTNLHCLMIRFVYLTILSTFRVLLFEASGKSASKVIARRAFIVDHALYIKIHMHMPPQNTLQKYICLLGGKSLH